MMFYSQYILDKKGPLGTVWIAAHLERKLRKSQVRQTNISDAVDSIIFPRVPIALRLSGHLLLGVVRIFSRKVNYLYHDCSEALVKIKQAFHSAQIDLPSDATVAPFHSITLPETFEFEYIELENARFQTTSNSDDHVTTCDQITLHDWPQDFAAGVQPKPNQQFAGAEDSYIVFQLNEESQRQRSLHLETPNPHITSLEEDVLPPLPLDGPMGFDEMDVKDKKSSSLSVCTASQSTGEFQITGTPQKPMKEPTPPADIPECETLRSAWQATQQAAYHMGLDELHRGEEISDTDGEDEGQRMEAEEPILEEIPVLGKGIAGSQMDPATPPRIPSNISGDDSLLASILGGASPALKVMPTPKTPAAADRRPRSRKRKQIMDESIALHNEFMRQQLINTHNIRRSRRMVPCSIIEVWEASRVSHIRQFFSEPSVPGMSTELREFYKRDLILQGAEAAFGKVPMKLRETLNGFPVHVEGTQHPPDGEATTVGILKIPSHIKESDDLEMTGTEELRLGAHVPEMLAAEPGMAELMDLEVEMPSLACGAEQVNAGSDLPAREAHHVVAPKCEEAGNRGLSFLEGDSRCVGKEVFLEEHDFVNFGEVRKDNDTNGWSTRTRDVAQYLQTAFQKLATHQEGAKLDLDRMLSRRSRKEAARMFFEILALTNKDYVEVEQEEAYAGIILSAKPKIWEAKF